MKNLILFLFLIISTGIQAQKMIHELPAKTNVDSTNWLFLTGNPTSGKLYKITAANLRDSIAPATDTTSLSNRINLKLNATDTASLSTRIDLKLNATDTASLSSRIDAISGGGGETLDSTLSLGNQTDETIIFTGPTDDYNFIEVNPIENHADQLVLNFTRWSQPQAGQINNEGLIFGFNINGGGGQIEAGLPALAESWETGYFPGSERWVEKHEIYLKPDATHIRLSSYTINTVTENIGFYHTVNTFQLTDETGPYLFASANAATGASKLQTNAANGTAALSIETNGTDNIVSINSLINTSPSELQFSAFELTTFNQDVQATRIGVGVAPSSWLLDVKGTGLQISGNFYSNFRVVNDTPDRGFYFGYDNTSAGSGIIASNAGYLAFWTYSGTWGERLKIKGNGVLNLSANARQVFADDAAAGAGGLVAGDIYQTSAGVLMIKQ